MKYWKLTIFKDSCGDFGCTSTWYNKIVAAHTLIEAKQNADINNDEIITGGEVFALPELKRKRKPFVVA